jgi:hypothetical protein
LVRRGPRLVVGPSLRPCQGIQEAFGGRIVGYRLDSPPGPQTAAIFWADVLPRPASFLARSVVPWVAGQEREGVRFPQIGIAANEPPRVRVLPPIMGCWNCTQSCSPILHFPLEM